MIIRPHWEVLLVDDDPDVLAISRLALKHIQVYGIPIKIHECASKADAIKFLQATAEISDLALAMIDVVMETEHAGLDVCKFIREDLNNRVTPIVVRTGQAGKAPEREVISRYEISTYLAKVEATNEKLYTTVLNAIRNYQYMRVLEGGLHAISAMIPLGRSRADILHGVPALLANIRHRRDGALMEHYQYHFCLLTEGDAIATGKFVGQEADARALRDRLVKEPSQMINAKGDRLVRVDNHMLLVLAGPDNKPAFHMVGETNYQPMPDYMLRVLTAFARSVCDQIALADQRS